MATDSFSTDFMSIMKSKNNPDSYPRIDMEYNLAERDYEANSNLRIVDRIQIQRSATSHNFLVRHSTRHHWCGYVLVGTGFWPTYRAKVESILGEGFISYAFPGFEPICWMVRNVDGKLKKAVDINPNGDFFLGFELTKVSRKNAMNHEFAMGVLEQVNQRIEEIAAQ